MNESRKQPSTVKVTDELAERLADDAEAGYLPGQIHARPTGRGRPRLAKGEGPSPTVNARLDDDLADLLEQRADSEGVPKSDIVREALRAYLV
ncbi:MAG: ribbon-helix-helix protein, CopG family [Actinobacteria bacterium]|nr:ribbon-helix-helix protein, CopG family [Actinomycetota bacterium]